MSKICGNCHAWREDSARFCQECGARLADLPVEPEVVEVVIEPPRRYESYGVDAREVRERLVGSKTEYYLPRFEKMEVLNSFTSWNWCAFLFGTTWMMYRKMYAIGIAFYVVGQVLSLMGAGLLSSILWVATGVIGNFLYMKDINNRTEKAMNMQPEEREAYIEKYGDTGWTGIVILLIVSVVINGALM